MTHVFDLDIVAGLGLGPRASVGCDVPIIVWQDGAGGLPASVVTGGKVPNTALGDAALAGKITIVDDNARGIPAGLGLAAVARVSLPTGGRDAFQGEGAATVSAGLLAEYAVGVGAVRASVGYALRTATRSFPDPSLGGATFGDSIPWSVALVARPGAVLGVLDNGDRQLWELGAHGALPVRPVAPFGLGEPGASLLSPVLFAADDRIALGHYRDAFLLVGAEVGVGPAMGVPDLRAVVALGWSPRAHDRDHDGVGDDDDQCPDLAEDRDGIQDDDGCPEDDADGDGILDPQDACPLVPGVFWSDAHRNGCPGPDADGDGIADPVDACPAVKGVVSDDPKRSGCPPARLDRDHDGVPDDADQCPDVPEDVDGVADFDGCPERGSSDSNRAKPHRAPPKKGVRP
jgi:hypothetical protein